MVGQVFNLSRQVENLSYEPDRLQICPTLTGWKPVLH
jgi:hypothetical protein